MIQTRLTLDNKLGLHARAAAKLVRLIMSYQAEVWIGVGDLKPVDARSINSLLTLGAPCGTELCCSISGPDEQEACRAIEALFAAKFGEQ